MYNCFSFQHLNVQMEATQKKEEKITADNPERVVLQTTYVIFQRGIL